MVTVVMEPKPQTLRVSDGGHLITIASPENVGPANYTEKTNWRRLDDKEVRREGTTLFSNVLTGVIGMWEALRPNGSRALVAATATGIYRFDPSDDGWDTLGTGFTATEWQGESIDGYLVLNNGVDLPVYFRVEDSVVTPMKEMREIGIGMVGTISIYNGFLLCADISEIIPAELNGVMNSGSPYGAVSSTICNRVRYKIGWSDYEDVTNWSPVITATILTADKDKIVLPYPVSAFPVGTRLAVVGAGAGNGVLDTVVTVVTGATLTVGVAADAGLAYPLTVTVTRFEDTSTFSGFASIQDDSSRVVRMRALKKILVVYRETGIWTGRYTGVVESPFIFTPEYSGSDVPAYPMALEDVEGDYHVYATGTRFYKYDGAGNPTIHGPLDNARSLFFANPGTVPFAKHNPVTKEIWFCNLNGVLAYDYLHDTASWIDEPYTAAVFTYQPGHATNRRFYMAKAAAVYQYGLLFGATVPTTYLRVTAVGGVPSITYGIGPLPRRSDTTESDLHGYMVLAAGGATDIDLTVTVWGKDNVAAPDEQLFSEVLDTPVTEPLIPAFFRNIYFKDRIQITDVADVGFAITGRTWLLAPVNSRGITRQWL